MLDSFLPDPTWENFSQPTPVHNNQKKEQLGFGFPKYALISITRFYIVSFEGILSLVALITSLSYLAGLSPMRCSAAGTTSKMTLSSSRSELTQRKEFVYEP